MTVAEYDGEAGETEWKPQQSLTDFTWEMHVCAQQLNAVNLLMQVSLESMRARKPLLL